MALKKMTDKARARMYFKRWKAGMGLAEDEITMVKKFYPFLKTSMEVR